MRMVSRLGIRERGIAKRGGVGLALRFHSLGLFSPQLWSRWE